MSRTSRAEGSRLPVLRHDSEVSRYSPRELVSVSREVVPVPMHPVHPVNRIEYLEEKLAVQEKTTSALLEKAYKIKEDLIDNLNFTHGTLQNEKHSRELLQEHIRNITDVVRRLSNDIMALEHNMKYKETETQGTSTAVKNLEIHQAAGITDLRGRVARCDASLAKLSSDINVCNDSVRQVSRQSTDSNAKLMDKLQALEQRMGQLGNAMDKNSSEHTLQIKHVEGDYSTTIQNLDTKTRSLVEETRTMMNSFKLTEENERAKLESRLVKYADRSATERDAKWDKFERKVEDTLQSLTKKLHKLEEDLAKDRERNTAVIQAMEKKLDTSLETQLRRQKEEMDRFKRECRQGFSTVHDSIGSMKQVMEGKQQLLEEQLRKEIGQIRKLVVLI